MPSDDRLDRRRFLTIAGGTAATVAIAGCSGDGGDGTTEGDGGSDGGDGGDGGSDGGDGGSDGGDGGSDGGDGGSGTTESGGGGSGTLTYARGNDSGTLDPQATSSGEDAKVIQQMYDQVIHFEPGKTTLTSGLAKEFELSGTTVSLTLREGVKFHNGEEFTSADFKATYRRFLDENYENFVGGDTRSYYGPYLLGGVEKVNTPDDYTVEIDLAAKNAPMLRNLAVFAFAIISKTAIESGDSLSQNPVGTGAFQFDNWNQSDGQIRLTRNGGYWGETAQVSEVVFVEIVENSSRASSLNAGEVDVIDGLNPQASQTVNNSGEAELVTTPGINIGYFAMNMARREEFRSQKVRQAFNYAIDTETLVNNIYSGQAVTANQPVPENMAGYNDSLDDYGHDPEQARTLLEEAGYGDGFEIEIATFRNPRTYNPSPGSAAQTVKANLENVGITCSINTQEFNAFIEYTNSGKHDVCFLGWMTDNADPDNFFNALLTAGPAVEDLPDDKDWISFDTEGFNTLNVAAWSHKEYNRLIKEGKQTYDANKRVSKYKQASKIAHDEAPWVFLDHAKELRGVHNRVSGFTIAPISGPFLNLVSVE
jgi:peptide/nickel transport system substrate-binding protein